MRFFSFVKFVCPLALLGGGTKAISNPPLYNTTGNRQPEEPSHLTQNDKDVRLSEIGDWRLEIGDWRLEIGDWRLEIGEEQLLLLQQAQEPRINKLPISWCRALWPIVSPLS